MVSPFYWPGNTYIYWPGGGGISRKQYRANPDEELRELERQAYSSGSIEDWDNYLAVLDRTGQLDEIIVSTIRRLPQVEGGPVSKEEAELLMRSLGYLYRKGVFPEIRQELAQWWQTDPVWQVTGSGKKIPKDVHGYYWILVRKPTTVSQPSSTMLGSGWFGFPIKLEPRADLTVHGRFYPIKIYPADRMSRRYGDPFGPPQADKFYKARAFLMCPICQQEIPVGRISNHFELVSHGASPTKRRLPVRRIMEMLARRLPQLIPGQEAKLSYTGNILTVTTRPENIQPIQDYLITVGLNLSAVKAPWHISHGSHLPPTIPEGILRYEFGTGPGERSAILTQDIVTSSPWETRRVAQAGERVFARPASNLPASSGIRWWIRPQDSSAIWAIDAEEGSYGVGVRDSDLRF